MPSAGKITRDEFDEALSRYPALLKSISISKTTKEGQENLTLESLDVHRFETAPSRYYKTDHLEDSEAAPTPLTHEDVVQLVRWKLKHGTFRPNLLKLAESNSPDTIQSTTRSAFKIYKDNSFEPSKAITELTTLKGIGPATASLLLSVHDCARVPFFSDELFQWIVHDGKKATIKYSPKEYGELVKGARKLISRLGGVDARDVEKVAFVLIKGGGDQKPKADTNINNAPSKVEREKKSRGRKAGPSQPKEPTDMTEERKAQLQEIAEKARAARVSKAEAKAAKGAKFRERVDAAREKKAVEGPSTPAAKPGAKRKGEVLTRGVASASKRSKRSGA